MVFRLDYGPSECEGPAVGTLDRSRDNGGGEAGESLGQAGRLTERQSMGSWDTRQVYL